MAATVATQHQPSISDYNEAKFWDALTQYKSTRTRVNRDEVKQFESVFEFYHNKLRNMMNSEICEIEGEPGSSIFNNDEFGIGADDGHDYLCHQIIWDGKQAVNAFIQDPKSALHIARVMSIAGTKGYAEFGRIFRD